MVPFLPLHKNRELFLSSKELGYEYSSLLDTSEYHVASGLLTSHTFLQNILNHEQGFFADSFVFLYLHYNNYAKFE